MTVTRIIRRAGFLALLLGIATSAVAAGQAGATPPPRPDLNPLFAAEWWLRGSLPVTDWVGGQRQSDGVDAIGAWPDTSGEGVVVAVVDSGVDLKTPSLDGRLVRGYDFITKGELKGDAIGHGTHVSTIIAGKPQHGDGIFGVAPDARILPLRVGNDYGHVIDGAAAGALAYALRDSQVRVINMSWGKLYSRVVARALAAAGRDPSVLMVSAAGNDATELFSSRLLPQSFDSDNEITVASTNYFDMLSFFSNFGTHVEVAAPGERVLSAFPGGTLYVADGTSMAAPMVSGVAALLFARYPQATSTQVKQAIVTSCTPVAELVGKVGCGGIVNAPRALKTLGTMLGLPR
jgi:thermitase